MIQIVFQIFLFRVIYKPYMIFKKYVFTSSSSIFTYSSDKVDPETRGKLESLIGQLEDLGIGTNIPPPKACVAFVISNSSLLFVTILALCASQSNILKLYYEKLHIYHQFSIFLFFF